MAARRQPFYVRFRSDAYEDIAGDTAEGAGTNGIGAGFMLSYTLNSDGC